MFEEVVAHCLEMWFHIVWRCWDYFVWDAVWRCYDLEMCWFIVRKWCGSLFGYVVAQSWEILGLLVLRCGDSLLGVVVAYD